jgi:hypothetical protein
MTCGLVPTRLGAVATTIVLLSTALATTVAAAVPAAAHTRAQAASNYSSTVASEPAIPGVTWRLYAGGDLIEVENLGTGELIILGYEGEPYLRLGPDGVDENRNSPATYLNGDRYADVAVPPRADASAQPDWTSISSARRWAWHDHRVHWMSPNPPPAVREARAAGTSTRTGLHLFDWVVPFTFDGDAHELTGTLRWVKGGPWWPWLVVALALTAPAAWGLVRRRPPTPGAQAALVRPAAAAVAAVAALNTIHFTDELLAWPAPTLDILFGVFHTALFVGVGLVGAAIAWRGRMGPLLSLGIASGAVLFHQGLLQVRILTSAELPTVWPHPLLRFAVALSVAQALWVAVVIAAANRGAPAPAPSRDSSDGSAASAVCPTPPAVSGDVHDPRRNKELI